MNEQAQFKAELWRYSNTHSFYSVDEFLMFKNDW
jgi:spore coat protein CotF